MKLGSLFDGSGGFPLAGRNNGIEPVWASEIEAFPIAVTKKNFPEMKHLGDIKKINGAEIEPVDIITFGSPCQDLSICGYRKGITGERSGLFFEAIRVIHEMREATNNLFPRYAVWENVPGAFTSNNGDDFFEVIKAFVKEMGYGESIPKPEKWAKAGCVELDSASLAWRLFNAKYWGVPQSRKRIYLVADFKGTGAKHILFDKVPGKEDS